MNYIFIRTSTTEQTPALQINDIKKAFSLEEFQLIEEQDSAYKETAKRTSFEKLKDLIKKYQVNNLYVWDLDRLYRNRVKLVEFLTLCKIYKTNVYSFNQQWLNSLQNIQPPFNEIMFNFMLEIMGWLAEDESLKKSLRVKMAVKKTQDGTFSYKGNRWGRKALSKQVIMKVKDLHQKGYSIRQIAAEVHIYDKNNNSKLISKSAVHKLITEIQ